MGAPKNMQLRPPPSFPPSLPPSLLPSLPPPLPPQVGRAWSSDELRRKSFDDLHKLWYVLYKERNVLLTEEAACKRNRGNLPSPERKSRVRKSMGRIKQVLKERALEAQRKGDGGNVGEEGKEGPLPQ